ncbi:potassium channel subfamily K member 5b [Chanos chanos]|uniref:Potassium channel subfamily K member 5b n=1 Tax=Chanos chanos TaxID=29144 RepID=A0A6J2V4H0_CHACN|nr:potassium channel subfamily K member 5-like [Chanos chanos]
MADKGPILTSAIIFYLSIGAAVFQSFEEPNWKLAVAKYDSKKNDFLAKYPCLKQEDLDQIVEAVAEAAGQGVTINGEKPFKNWSWQNALVFALTIITTIGYGNVAPKTVGGRIFCILYGLCGIPLCLTWMSELGSFFGDRAKRLSQVLLRKGLSVRKVQFTCTALFLLWGLLVHLVIPPFVFMIIEEWTYLEGLYFSFITLTTVGFGDYVAGANPVTDYPVLYCFFVQMWICMGLAWLSLFFTWNVHMVVEAHKVLKKRRQRRHNLKEITLYQLAQAKKDVRLTRTQSAIDIFNFMSEKTEDYADVIRNIGKKKEEETQPRSKSCSDLLDGLVIPLDHSPRMRRHFSYSENISKVIAKTRESIGSSAKDPEEQRLLEEAVRNAEDFELAEPSLPGQSTMKRSSSYSGNPRELYSPVFESPNVTAKSKEDSENQTGTRFSVYKVPEGDLLRKDTG